MARSQIHAKPVALVNYPKFIHYLCLEAKVENELDVQHSVQLFTKLLPNSLIFRK